ncbi:hypothetical protein HOY82DRAFT_631240 [Tuber indicum]|nr:hypothetical protein HOY82DRAFT_631240 [Tuber indicum]
MSTPAFSIQVSRERMATHTSPVGNPTGLMETHYPRADITDYENQFLLAKQCIARGGFGGYKNRTFVPCQSASIRSEVEDGGARRLEINFQHTESLATGHMFDINQEFFHMIKTGQRYLWRGSKGRFAPPSRGDNAVKPTGSTFRLTMSPDGKEIYSRSKLHCRRRYFESWTKQLDSNKGETTVEADKGQNLWEIDGDSGEESFGCGSDDSEFDSDEMSDLSDEESEEGDTGSDDVDVDSDEDEADKRPNRCEIDGDSGDDSFGYGSDDSEFDSDKMSDLSDEESEEGDTGSDDVDVDSDEDEADKRPNRCEIDGDSGEDSFRYGSDDSEFDSDEMSDLSDGESGQGDTDSDDVDVDSDEDEDEDEDGDEDEDDGQ